MTSAIELAGFVLATVPIAVSGAITLREIGETVLLANFRSSWKNGRGAQLRKEYGILRALLLLLVFPDVLAIIDQIERHVFGSRPDEALLLRKSFSSDCTMLAVASAIIAQVAITAFSLANIDQTHWTAQAMFTISLIAGCLSVVFACLIQQTMNSLHRPEDIKDWLSKPSSSYERRNFERTLHDVQKILFHSQTQAQAKGQTSLTSQKLNEGRIQVNKLLEENRWKAASFNSALMLTVPTQLLITALGSFLIGLGIYLGFLLTKGLDPGSGSDAARAILIVYVIFTTAGLLLYYLPSGLKEIESMPLKRWARLIDDLEQQVKEMEEKEASSDRDQSNIQIGPSMKFVEDNPGIFVDLERNEHQNPHRDQPTHFPTAGSAVPPMEPFSSVLQAAIRAQEENLRTTRLLIDEYKKLLDGNFRSTG